MLRESEKETPVRYSRGECTQKAGHSGIKSPFEILRQISEAFGIPAGWVTRPGTLISNVVMGKGCQYQ